MVYVDVFVLKEAHYFPRNIEFYSPRTISIVYFITWFLTIHIHINVCILSTPQKQSNSKTQLRLNNKAVFHFISSADYFMFAFWSQHKIKMGSNTQRNLCNKLKQIFF